jgi:hypothetical protein
MLRLTNVQAVEVMDIEFVGKTNAGKPKNIINVYRSEPKTGTIGNISDCIFQRIAAHGNKGAFIKGLVFSCATPNNGAADQNNEQATISDCYFEMADSFGISFEHQNSLWHRLNGGRISGYVACINNVRSDGTSGGGFSSYSTTFMNPGGNSVCFNLTGSQYPVFIADARSEGGAGLLRIRPNKDPGPIDCNVVFTGGSFKLGTPAPGHYHIDIAGKNTKVTFNNGFFYSRSGVKIRSDKCDLVIDGGIGNISSLEYSGLTTINNYHSDANIGFTNMGGGVLLLGEDNSKNLSTFLHIGDKGNNTLIADGKSFFEYELTSPLIIKSITGGYTGQEITIFAGSSTGLAIGGPGSTIFTPNSGSNGTPYPIPKFTSLKLIKTGPA